MNRSRLTFGGMAALVAVLTICLGLGAAALAVWQGYFTLPTLALSSTISPLSTPQSGGVYLVGAGDIAECGLPGAGLTANLLAQFPGAALFTAGDNSYQSGSLQQFKNCFNPTWGRYKERIHPAIGNHEYVTQAAKGYFDYFDAAAGPPGLGWYSYDLGGWHILVLNSECNQVKGCQAGSPQEKWLKADLAAHPGRCSLAIWHHPRFSSGPHGSSSLTQDFWKDLYAAGVELVINGHDHDYERFAPMDASGVQDPARGIRQFVVGTGGALLYDRPGQPAPNSQKIINGVYGVLALTLYPDHYDWKFIPQAGILPGDSGSGSCH